MSVYRAVGDEKSKKNKKSKKSKCKKQKQEKGLVGWSEGRKREGKRKEVRKGRKEALFISVLEGAKAKRGFNYAL